MKYRLLYTLGLIVLGWSACVATPVEAVTAAGPYYAPPSWDQLLQCDTTATCPRFIVLSNFTGVELGPDGHRIPTTGVAVMDRETGLVWEQSPNMDTHDWFGALSYCNNLTVGNRMGWRLPTLQELASLLDPSVPIPGPALAAGHPFSNVQSSSYWSATTYSEVDFVAWVVNFGGGDHVLNANKGGDLFVWCVRGGHGVNPK